jgi:hypothetical protein
MIWETRPGLRPVNMARSLLFDTVVVGDSDGWRR